MQSGNFAELDRVHNQRNITVSGKPDSMTLMLRRGFCAIASAPVGVSALIENRRITFRASVRTRRLWKIEIGGDIETRRTLEMKLFDCVTLSFKPPCDGRLERCLLGHRLEPEHVEKVFAKRRSNLFEIRRARDSRQKLALEIGSPQPRDTRGYFDLRAGPGNRRTPCVHTGSQPRMRRSAESALVSLRA